MARNRSRQAETEDVNQRRLKRGAVSRQHIQRWAVGATELAPGVVGDVHLHPSTHETIRDIIADSGAGHLLVLSGSGVSVSNGGDYVTFDMIVEQHGFPDVTVAGESWIMPIAAVGLITVEVEWDSYEGGGTIELEVDGTVPPSGLVASGTVGQRGRGTVPFYAPAAAVCRLKVTQESGEAQTAQVTVRVAISDPATEGASTTAAWTRVFTADAYDLTHDGTSWWTTEGNSGETVSERGSDGVVASSFEATSPGGSQDRVRGVTFDGTHLWLVGDADGIVARYTLAGVLASSFSFLASWSDDNTVGVAFDGTDLWIMGDQTDDVRRYSTAGSALQTISLAAGTYRGVAFYDGDLYVVDMGNDRLLVIQASDGSSQGTIDVSDAVSGPTGVWVSSTGELYVSKDGDGVYLRTVLL